MLPLTEQYRPKEFNDVVGLEDVDRLANIISKPDQMPNLLFHGPAGVGKTTVAKIIIDKMKPIDYIKINGSDTTGVDTIRERVYGFMTSMSSEKNKPKIVWIEEFDYMSQNAFAALRSMMEQYISNARFICTCNYIKKIPEPIQSRFTSVEFKKPDIIGIMKRARQICEEERIEVGQNVLQDIVTQGNGDLRTIINNIQRLSSNSDKKISESNLSITKNLTDEVYVMINESKWSEIRYNIPNKRPDYNTLLVDLEDKFFNSDLPTEKKAKITETISDGLYEMSFSFDSTICFSAVCSRIIKILL